ncbi:MAG: recombinase family protein [Comamonadaceae bacterium]|nr:recombinase family protein [Comamonadaceae bacterium]
MREGDTVVVTKLDRIARSTKDLLDIVETLQKKGVRLPRPEHQPGHVDADRQADADHARRDRHLRAGDDAGTPIGRDRQGQGGGTLQREKTDGAQPGAGHPRRWQPRG